MDIKKKIEVTVTVCDICEKPTTRNLWRYSYAYRFCKEHKWIEPMLDIMNQKHTVHNLITFLKEEIKSE